MDMIGYFSTEELLILVWDVSQKFLRRKRIWILFLRNKYLTICVLPLLLQSEEGLLEVPLGSWKLLELTSVSRFLAYVRVMDELD